MPNMVQQAPGAAVGLYRSNSVTGNIVTTPTSSTAKPASTPITQPIAPTRFKSIANATSIDTLLIAADNKESFTQPPDSVQDKTAFIFNNLSQLNLTQKCEEIKEFLTKDYHQWLSHYLVLKRASIELNFHGLYSNFLDALKIPEVNKLVTKETFRNIKVLLRSDKGIANFSDRSLLKNLGHWLGMLTLARNKPILQIDIDLKSLLVEAYHKGQQELLYVVPFVAKVLESCAKSKVFKTPNPWTMALMNVLAELHQEPDLKLNLKFEIEVLCKNLSIDVADLKPAVYLKDPERILTIEYQLSQPLKQKDTQQAAAVLATLPTSEETTTATSIASQSPSAIEGSGIMMTPPEPRFTVVDINVSNLSAIANQIVYNPNIGLLLTHPQLKQVVRTAIERTITEWITPVVDRSVKIALKTSEQIVRKDFSLEPDEIRIRNGAHNMVRNLAAGMAMITCRDQLLQNIQNSIKSMFMNALSPAQKDMVEIAAGQLAADNTELACVFIQKSAMEKAVQEIDKLLAQDYDIRKQARQEGRRYYDTTVLSYQAERLPESIRLKVGAVTPQQLAVYDEFARNIPGFQPMSERDPSNTFMPKLPNFFQDPITPMPPMATVTPFANQHSNQVQSNIQPFDEISVIYDEIIGKMESFLSSVINTQQLQVHAQNIQAIYECLIGNNRRIRDNLSGIALLKRAVENLMEGLMNIPDCGEQIKLYRDIHLRLLRLLQDNRNFGLAYTNKSIAKYMMECREEVRYNIDTIDLLISSNFVHLPTYDQLLTQLIDNGSNYVAISLSMQLVQMYFVDERQEQVVTENDFINTIEILARLASHPRAPEGLPHLIDMLRSNQDPTSVLVDRAVSGPTSYIHSGMVQARTTDLLDSDGFAEKTEHLFRHWVYQFHNEMNGRDPLKIFSGFVSRMNYLGVLKGDEQLTKFFSIATKMCIDASYRNLSDPTNSQSMAKAKTFHWIDAYIRLISLLVKHSGDGGNSSTKLNLLNKVLGIVVGTLLQDQEIHGTNFQQFGYHRIFIMLFHELTAHDPILENISVGVVTAFCHTYHILRPSNAPGFCYSWLELISNRVFIGRILAMIPQQKGWFMYSQLLVDLFKYLAPFLRNAELAKPVTVLYKGTLRVLLVLLHDFPEFLCDYHFGFCDVIPPNCIQMRNLILSAYPRNMRLPDPFTPNLKVSMLNDIATPPRICTNYAAAIQPASFKKDLDSYLKQRAPVTFFAELKRNLQVSNEPGSRYNISLMNALVLYVGTQAITHIRLKNQVPGKQTVASSAHMDIFQNLAVDSDNEGRYLFLNAIANQLRYPNSHTHYFSCTLLYLFHETNSEAIQEQITRVLLERLIVNRPHPWGLLITFIELIKNPDYEFWNHDFVHCAPEIEKLFESVARSCMVKTSNQQQIQNTEVPEMAELN
jgi:CCR4-NOT transcription complex subunit 1